LPRDPDCWFWCEFADPIEQRTEFLSLQELGYDERATVLESTHVDNLYDVGMSNRSGGLSFAFKAGQNVGLIRNLIVQEFNGKSLTAKPGVPGFINSTHAAFAYEAHDLIASGKYRTNQRIIV
jgi:hypothetical protein